VEKRRKAGVLQIPVVERVILKNHDVRYEEGFLKAWVV
jgi:hypothetical protein